MVDRYDPEAEIRYDFDGNPIGVDVQMVDHIRGDWVRIDDFSELQSEYDHYIVETEEAVAEKDDLINELNAEIAKLKDLLENDVI